MTNLNLRQTKTLKRKKLPNSWSSCYKKGKLVCIFVGTCVLQPNNNLGGQGKVLTMSLMDTLYSIIQELPALTFLYHRKTHGTIWTRLMQGKTLTTWPSLYLSCLATAVVQSKKVSRHVNPHITSQGRKRGTLSNIVYTK